MNESHIRNVIEAALLAAGKSLQPKELVELFDDAARPQLQDILAALNALMEEYSNRGIELKETAAGWRIQVRPQMANEISRLWPERPAKYSRALLETLALIAYRQPITRAEIEAVRGVAVNQNILKTVIERNWVRVVGHRDVPGRPELLGTTRDFLDYFGLRSLDELPSLAELKAIGEIKVQFDLPDPGPLLISEGNGATGEPEGDTAATAESVTSQSDAPESIVTEVVAESVVEQGVVVDGVATAGVADEGSAPSRKSGGKSGRKRQGKAHTADTALHEAEEFAASVDADLAAGDDDGSDDDELSAAGPDSSELVAGPRDIDD